MAMEKYNSALEYVCEHILGLPLDGSMGTHVTKPFTVCCEDTEEEGKVYVDTKGNIRGLDDYMYAVTLGMLIANKNLIGANKVDCIAGDDYVYITMSSGEYKVHYKRYTGDVIDLYNRIYGNMFSTENVTKEQANSVYRKITEDLKYAD